LRAAHLKLGMHIFIHLHMHMCSALKTTTRLGTPTFQEKTAGTQHSMPKKGRRSLNPQAN